VYLCFTQEVIKQTVYWNFMFV